MERSKISPCIKFLEGFFEPGMIGVEIGIGGGEHATGVLKYVKPSKYYMIDPYKVWKEYNYTQEKFDSLYNEMCSTFGPLKNTVIMRMTSEEAAPKVENNLDFVYIDGAHTYEMVTLDLNLWYPKIRPGGVLCGDDYNAPGVKKAVDEFVAANDLKIELSINSDPHPTEFWAIKEGKMSEIITYACITQNRIGNIKRNIPKVIDYVDRFVIVDGFSIDGTKEWLESYSPKIKVVQRKWDDSFANQYNEYLKYVDEGWVLICDDDEIPSEEMLKCLPQVIADSNEGKRYSAVEFRCNPLEVNKEGKIIEDHGPENYYRQLFFKYHPGVHYIIDLHQALVGLKNHNRVRRQEVYYHLKSDEDMYRNACRNWWIDGIWLSNASSGVRPSEWHELKEVVKDCYPNVKVFGDLNAILVKGNIDKRLKDFLWKIKDTPDEIDKGRPMNELRAYWTYYFEKLHPEELENV